MSSSAALSGCGGGGGGGGTGGGTGGVTPPVFPLAVPVVMTKPYTDTGVSLTVGEQLTLTTTGIYHYTPSNVCTTSDGCTTTPAGEPVANCAKLPNFTAPSLPCWSLIGKIGSSGVPFEVGDSLTLTAATAGELYIGPNDNYYSDNSGAWTTIIRM